MTLDNLTLEIRRSKQRKTLQLTLERDGRVIVLAPIHTDEHKIQEFVQNKRFWLYTKLAEKQALRAPASPKRYLQGEGFLYLGHSYRLKLVEQQLEPLKLMSSRFLLKQSAHSQARWYFIQWYTEQARHYLKEQVVRYQQRMSIETAWVQVQDLGYRWGSCSKNNTLYFHWKTILLAPTLIEYIVVHELAHLQEPRHTPAFWQQVSFVLPDYQSRKIALAQLGVQIDSL